jgi:hypothetical protein
LLQSLHANPIADPLELRSLHVGLGLEVFITGTSAWVAGCSSDSSGLLVSVIAECCSADVCGWVVL